jgi:hypothetical protein
MVAPARPAMDLLDDEHVVDGGLNSVRRGGHVRLGSIGRSAHQAADGGDCQH